MTHLALAGACLCLAFHAPALAAPSANNAKPPQQQSQQRASEQALQSRAREVVQGTCPAGQHAPGNAANGGGSPFNPNSPNRGRDNSNYQNGCKDDAPSSP